MSQAWEARMMPLRYERDAAANEKLRPERFELPTF